jgi:alkylation response protein AidB-like acyl-CoA dehydrogenase
VDIELSDEQRFLQETVSKFLEHEAPLSTTRQRAGAGEPPLADGYWSRFAELGVAAMLVPEEYGGVGTEQPVLDLVVVAEEMGRQIAPGPLLPVSVVATALARTGSAEQKQRYLPGLAEGSLLATWAVAEPPDRWDPAEAGSTEAGLAEAATTARRDGEDWVLSGTKSSVEAADVADVFLVTARTDAGTGQFLVARDAPGLTVRPLPQYDLGRLFADLDLNEVRVPASAVVGEPGTIDTDLDQQYLLALTLQAAETAGLLERIFEVTLDYVRDRYTFGRPLASYQALKHRIADHKLWLEAALGLSTALAQALAAGDAGAAQLASVTKAHVGDQSTTIISDCGQLFGGIAMTWEHDLHLYLRRATANKFLYGSPAQHRERLCRLIGL